MKCPYCTSAIADEALVCPQCTRDLYLFKPLLARLQQLEDEVTALRARSEAVAAPQGLAVPGALRGESAEEVDGPADAPPFTSVDEAVTWPAWVLLLPALLLLLAAHGVIVMLLDLPTVWLRLASVAIPLPFGVLLLRGVGSRVGPRLLATAAVALLAVTGMSAVVAWVDGTPVLPADARELREFLSYAASIFLSFVTGMLAGWQHRRTWQRPSAVLRQLGDVIWGVARDPKKAQVQLDALRNLIAALTTTAAAIASLASGLQGVLGG